MEMMKMEAMFNIVLVERFVASIRKRGEISLPSSLSSKNVETMSTPFLAWIFSQRKKGVDLKVIQETFELDQQRSEFVVGHSIFEDQSINNYPELEMKYLKAREIIKSYWPELACLIEVIEPRVSFLPNDDLKYESSSDPKTFGEIIFNMENSCLRSIEKYRKLFALVSMAYTICWATGIEDGRRNPVKVKKHGYPQFSVFRRGLNLMRAFYKNKILEPIMKTLDLALAKLCLLQKTIG